jgi:hypothetical protein
MLAPLAAAALLAAAAVAGASMIGIYRNSLETVSQRSQLRKLSGRSCDRGGSDHTLKVTVGKRTDECAYSTPVVGRDLEVLSTERLLSGTPKKLRHRAFLALELRAGGGARYQLAVYPMQRKVQLRKVMTDGSVKYLAIARDEPGVRGINGANALGLRATNVRSGPEKGTCEIRGFLGSKLVVKGTDPAAGDLAGRASAVAVGARGSATGAIASFDDVVVRVPSPF